MKLLKLAVLLFFLAALVMPMVKTKTVKGQDEPKGAPSFSTAPGSVDSDPALDPSEPTVSPDGTPTNVGPADTVSPDPGASDAAVAACLLKEAPTGFDDKTNGFVSQGQHTADQEAFEEVDFITDGLGPVYNAQSCRECHQNPVTGGISQITELRGGKIINSNFVPADIVITDDTGNNPVTIFARSLINDRAICPAVHSDIVTNPSPPPGFPAIFRNFNFPFAQAQEHVPETAINGERGEFVTTFRTSLNLLGDGFVESINSNTLATIANNQPVSMRGTLVFVPLLESPGCVIRLGRFGWKNQQSSLLSFSSDAYLNEMGITNRLAPNNADVTSTCDVTVDPEDVNNDIDVFASFMRATKAPSRARGDERFPGADPDIVAGSNIFSNMPGAPAGQSCVTCHVRNIRTAAVGSQLGGGAIPVPAALGCKVIHPFGDFLMHNIGTGDRIVQTTFPCITTLDQSNQLRMRTAPLWGVRTRDRLMHDGESLTFNQAILRHDVEAHNVIVAYMALSITQKNQLIKFLKSL
jgi:Di-haem oxidoreductase, putative peroxidase